ncbi:MAG: FixH family protein [Sulfurospirillaceae bacterium]|nr:FixH family protein [Sulfurospirillaceae bacterium]
MSKKKNRNYWPQGIIGMILAVVAGGAYTVNLAIHNPVQEDTYFMEKYQKVDKNINKLMNEKIKFDNNFNITYSSKKLKTGLNSFYIELHNKKTNKLVNNADITLLVTRPETNEFNQFIKPSKVEKGQYIFTNIKINKLGRWKLLTNIKVNKFDGYDTYEVYAAK